MSFQKGLKEKKINLEDLQENVLGTENEKQPPSWYSENVKFSDWKSFSMSWHSDVGVRDWQITVITDSRKISAVHWLVLF